MTITDRRVSNKLQRGARSLTHINRELEDRTDFKLDRRVVDEEICDPERGQYME